MKQRLRHFTLVELLTATAILLIIMTILVQMLSTLMKGWRLSETNTRLYANAKEVLNILQDDLNSVDCYRRPWFGPVVGSNAMVRIDGFLSYQATGNIRLAIPTRNAAGDTIEAHYYYRQPIWKMDASGKTATLEPGTATLYRRETPKELCDYTVQGMESSWWKSVDYLCKGTYLPPTTKPPLNNPPWLNSNSNDTTWKNECQKTWAAYDIGNDSEDLDSDGVLDPGEDLNGNGRLDPFPGLNTTLDINGNGVIGDIPLFLPFGAVDVYTWRNWRNTISVTNGAIPAIPSSPNINHFFTDPAPLPPSPSWWDATKTDWSTDWHAWGLGWNAWNTLFQPEDVNHNGILDPGEDTYPSEDVNNNGILDPGEDLNANGILDRGNGKLDTFRGWQGIDGLAAWGMAEPDITKLDEHVLADGVVEFSLKASTRSPSSSLYLLLVSITVVDPDEVPKDRNKDGTINGLDYTSRHTFTRLLVVP